jgi:hypothetical protein
MKKFTFSYEIKNTSTGEIIKHAEGNVTWDKVVNEQHKIEKLIQEIENIILVNFSFGHYELGK